MLTMIVSNPKGILLLAILALLPMASAWAQDPGAYAGYINTQVRQQIFREQNTPYLSRPVTEQDFKPGPPADEPVIMYSEQDVQGKVMPSVPPPGELHVK